MLKEKWNKFRSLKLFNTLHTLFTFEYRRKKKQFFNWIRTYFLDIETKIKRNAYSIQFKSKSAIYRAWKEYAKQRVQDKLFQQYKEEKIKEKVNEERASYHFKIETQRKYFNMLKIWFEEIKEEKEISKQNEIKLQTFLEQMKLKAEEKKRQEEVIEIERRKLEQENQKDISTLLELVKNAGASLEIVQGNSSMPVSINIPINESTLLSEQNNDVSLSLLNNKILNKIEEDKFEENESKISDLYETPEKLSKIEDKEENVSLKILNIIKNRILLLRNMILKNWFLKDKFSKQSQKQLNNETIQQ